MTKSDVAIVGAGFAGLAAARRVRELGLSAMVIEARPRVGGRVLSLQVGDETVEMGAQWIGPGQDRVRALAHEFGLTVRPRPEDGAECFYRPDDSGQGPACRVDSAAYDLAAVGAAVMQLDALAQMVDVADPIATAEHQLLDAHTVASWARSNLPADVHGVIFTICEGFLGAPVMVSFLHFLFYAKANGGVAALLGLGVERHDSEVITEGLSSLAVRLADTLGESIRYATPVRRIVTQPAGATLYGDTGVIVEARAVILAVPPIVAGLIAIDPSCNADRMSIERRYIPLSRLKFQLVFDRPFWRDKGLSGAISGGSFFTFDGSISERAGVLTGFFGTTEAFALWSKPQAERQREALRRVAMMFGDDLPPARGYDDKFWLDEPFSMGCVAAPGPGVWTHFGHALRAHAPPLFRAGSEVATVMPGQIEGAIRSGNDAAEAAAKFRKD